jgi:hypothetical protein
MFNSTVIPLAEAEQRERLTGPSAVESTMGQTTDNGYNGRFGSLRQAMLPSAFQ